MSYCAMRTNLFATRLRIDDMLPIAQQLDQIGYWSLECWGGATFDSCIRFLGEDPWQRLRFTQTSHAQYATANAAAQAKPAWLPPLCR